MINISNNSYFTDKIDLGFKINAIIEKDSNQHQNTIFFKKGETIFKQGVYISNVVFIKNGLAKQVIESNNHKELIIDFCLDNWFVGLSFMEDTETYPFSLTALNDCEIVMYKVDEFKAIVDNNSTLKALIDKSNRNNHKLFYQKIISLGLKNMFGRLAEVLIQLSSPCYEKQNIFKYLSRKDLADYAGMSLESMIRVLNELKNDKIITIQNKKIVINDVEMLIRLCKVG